MKFMQTVIHHVSSRSLPLGSWVHFVWSKKASKFSTIPALLTWGFQWMTTTDWLWNKLNMHSFLLTSPCLLSFRPSRQSPTAQQHNAHSQSGSDDIGVVPQVTIPVAQEQIIPQHCYIKCYRWTRKFYDGHNSAYSVKPFPGMQCSEALKCKTQRDVKKCSHNAVVARNSQKYSVEIFASAFLYHKFWNRFLNISKYMYSIYNMPCLR